IGTRLKLIAPEEEERIEEERHKREEKAERIARPGRSWGGVSGSARGRLELSAAFASASRGSGQRKHHVVAHVGPRAKCRTTNLTVSNAHPSASGCGEEQELMALAMAVAAPPTVTTDRRRPLLVPHATAAAPCGPRLSVCTGPSGRCGIVLSIRARLLPVSLAVIVSRHDEWPIMSQLKKAEQGELPGDKVLRDWSLHQRPLIKSVRRNILQVQLLEKLTGQVSGLH
ncbi:unnamed protein product, partial [Lampetra planeri]